MENSLEKRRRCCQMLELPPGASEDEIKKAYKSMALRYHPDKNSSPDANEKFQEISAAYNYLMEGDDYLRRLEHEDVNLFDFFVTKLFSWIFNPRPSYGGAFNMNNMYFDEDEDDDDDYEDDEDYVDGFYSRNFNPTFQRSWRPENIVRPPGSSMFGRNLSSPRGFYRHTPPPSDFSSYRNFTFTHANAQHGQYYHETKQSKQQGKSAKRCKKDARMARKEKTDTCSGKSHSSSSFENHQSHARNPPAQNTRQTTNQRHNQRSPTPCETQNKKEAKEGDASNAESIRTENQSTKKSKKQIKAEEKLREQEMSEIRQQLQEQEEKKRRQAEERRIAQELKEKTEREAKEEERMREEERLRIEQEAARQRMEEENREKAKKAAEAKKRKELLRKFENNPFLNDDGSFQSTDSDLMNIIRTDIHSETPAENSENVESINGIPVSELARLQNMALNGHSDEMNQQENGTMKGKDTKHGYSTQPKTKVQQRIGSRQAQRSATRSEMEFGPSPVPRGFTPKSANFCQGNFQQQQHPFHQWSQNQRQPTPYVSQPHLPQPRLHTTQHSGPTAAPLLPPPQLNRPPPPLRFNFRPVFPRQPSSNFPATRFPNQPYKMNAI